MGKTLVAFFSYSGRTAKAAIRVAELVGADFYEIRTVRNYSQDYRTCVEQAREEKFADARPALAAEVPDLTAYDRIVVAYPNWCSTCPMAVLSFLESADLTGKHLYPLVTHGGGGISGEADIKRVAKGAIVAKAKDGNYFRDSEITAWLY